MSNSDSNLHKRKRIADILAEETGGKSYKTHKYSLDHDHGVLDYDETQNSTFKWLRRGETEVISGYKDIHKLADKLSKDEREQVLTYFLDGSRRVYKVDEVAYILGKDKSVIYPTIAGQIGVGICRRQDKRLISEKFEKEIVISLPEIAEAHPKNGFWEAVADKLNKSNELQRIVQTGWRFSTPILYKVDPNEKKFEDRGTALIQAKMMEHERNMVKKLVNEHKLNQNNYLVKDGSLEYRLKKAERDNDKTFMTFKQNYNWVIGLSKRFNPESCFEKGKPNSDYIARLPLYSRTPVACFGNDKDNLKFAVWYVRLREQTRTRSPFDGVLKVEKILVREDEERDGMETDLVDKLSALIINERNPTCYGSDTRWANHIYPVYLTESYVKSQYLSTESFLHLF